jgi:GxxExxY protein
MDIVECNTDAQWAVDKNTRDELSGLIVGAAIEVHRVLGGPGLFESIYEAALCRELQLRGLRVQRQKPIQVVYKGESIKDPFYLDLVVEGKIILEIKATEKNYPIFETQVLTYLRLTGLKLGLLINFGYPCVKDGVLRVINGYF